MSVGGGTQYVLSGEKPCSKCRRRKPVEEFPVSTKLSSGYSSWCRSCHVEAVRAWRERNPTYSHARRKATERRTCALDGCNVEFETSRPPGFHNYCKPAHQRKANKQRERAK